MSKYTDKCKELRASEDPRYNCCQAVVAVFAEKAGISEADACRVAANFGGGMRRASTCGAIAGGLMAMGLLGLDAPADTTAYYAALKESHGGVFECAQLLAAARAAGIEKKPHCDGMCLECVSLVEKLLTAREGA